ncbi:MAG: hypothetical protein ABFD94_04210 [Armatimonadia bacterium]
MNRTCRICKAEKPASSEFFRLVPGRHSNGKKYLKNTCLECDREQARKRMQRLLQAPEYRIKFNMRRQLVKAACNDGVAETIRLALKRGHNSPFLERELGYTASELRAHLERQFHDGMTWDDYLSGKIHIDHIMPKASFDLSKHEEWVACWSLPNLRPLWALDNTSKSDKTLFLI